MKERSVKRIRYREPLKRRVRKIRLIAGKLVVAAEIEISGVELPVATEIGDVPLTLVTVPLDGVVQLIPPLTLVDKTCPLVPTELLMIPLELFKITPEVVKAGITICPLPCILKSSFDVVSEVPA